MQDGPDDSSLQNDWVQIRPFLDEALLGLGEKDRAAILLRYFEGRGFAEIASLLSLTEEAAYKRVGRALERLRTRLLRRGITSSAATLATALGAHAGSAAPTGLAANVTGLALASASAAGAAGPFGAIKFLGAAKSAIGLAGIIGAAAIVATATVGLAVHEVRANRHAQSEVAAARQEVAATAANLSALKSREQSEERTLAGLLARAGAVPHGRPSAGRSGSAASAADHEPDPLEEGRRFLTAYPQAQALLLQMNEAAIYRRFGPFFRLANLTPSQISRFDELMASDWVNGLAIAPSQFGLGPISERARAQLDELLGPQATQALQAYRDTLLHPYSFTNEAAAAAGEAGVPLSEEQCDFLARSIAGNVTSHPPSPEGIGLGYVNTVAAAVDWDAVLADARETFPTAQFTAIQGALLNVQFRAQLAAAQINQARAAGASQ
jgi:hypothetical protein